VSLRPEASVRTTGTIALSQEFHFLPVFDCFASLCLSGRLICLDCRTGSRASLEMMMTTRVAASRLPMQSNGSKELGGHDAPQQQIYSASDLEFGQTMDNFSAANFRPSTAAHAPARAPSSASSYVVRRLPRHVVPVYRAYSV